jgi:hypothetical protein
LSPVLPTRKRAQTILKALPKASAQPQSRLGPQDDLVLATVLEFQTANSIEVHDDRAVNTNEPFIAQVALQLQ